MVSHFPLVLFFLKSTTLLIINNSIDCISSKIKQIYIFMLFCVFKITGHVQELLPPLLVYGLTFLLGVMGNILIILAVMRRYRT